MFGRPLKGSVAEILRGRYHSRVDSQLGFVILVFDITVGGQGLVSSTGETIHRVEFSAVVFSPRLHEIIRGEVIEVAEFGAFVRIGPTDAVLHRSQISRGPVRVDVKAGTIHAGRHPSPLKTGSRVLARVSACSGGSDGSIKVGLTCNEPALGPEERSGK